MHRDGTIGAKVCTLPDPSNTKKEGDLGGKDKIAAEAKRRKKGY